MAQLLHSLPKKTAAGTLSGSAAAPLRLLEKDSPEGAGNAKDAPPEEAGVELSLRALLRETSAEDLGFPPDRVPDHMRVTLPLALIGPQLGSGRVMVRVQDLRAGVQESFRPAFAKATAGLLITVPMQEIFTALPDSALSSLYPAPVRPGRLSRPPGRGVGGAVTDDAKNDHGKSSPSASATLARPVPATASAPPPPLSSSIEGFAGPPVTAPDFTKPEIPAPLSPEEIPTPETAETSEAADDLGEPFSARALCTEPPARLSPVTDVLEISSALSPETGVTEISGEHAEAPDGTAVFSKRLLPNRLLLVALFATENSLTVSEVLRCCGELPGLGGCALMAAGNFLTGGNPPAEDCRALAAGGNGLPEHFAALGRGLALGKDSGLTLRAGQGWRTFFTEKNTVLTVWHGDPDFRSGVCEKLILTLRELASLSGD